MSGSPINLHIPGDHVALEELADALDTTLLDELRSREDTLSANEINFESSWRGKSADAFVACCLELKQDIDAKVSEYVADVGEVIRAYAWRIKRGKDLFADYADAATQGKLIVQGDYILPPTARRLDDASLPCSVTDIDPDLIYMPDPFELFSEITQKVGEWHGEHKVWVATYFGPLMQSSDSASGLSKLLDNFEANEFTLFTGALEGSKHKVGDLTSTLQESLAQHEADYDRFTKALHAGNYQLKQAAEAVTGTEFQKYIDGLEESLGDWRKAGSVLKSAGPVATVAESATELLSGEGVGKTAAGIGGGAAGAAAGANWGAKFGGGNPISKALLTGVGAGVGTLLGSGLAKSAWDVIAPPKDKTVPLGVREEIIDWFANPGDLHTGQARGA